MTSDKMMTPQEFALLARRAGLELTAQEIDALFQEIAASCALMGEMAERVKARLAPASEPAHRFQPTDELGNGRN